MRSSILFITAYIIGSVNFSILLFKILGKGDPRDSFSGNAGVVNVYRQAGYFLATIILVLDIARSMGVAVMAQFLLPAEMVPWCGLGLILGNSFPCFHHFMGGKGVANYLGFTFVVSPVWAGISMAAWIVAYMLFKLPFIASFLMLFILALGTAITGNFSFVHITGVTITLLLIVYNHRRNINEFMEARRKY
ncbi:putative Glycerol-3-phosphate acyltransferase [uncultured Desulfobacterium sp.]|uniref:Glycerol-3-phosphate acyltransferase n=1 Tax=uncultured Desulfobacterium sp. TaxID=201089 RepID=A0A445MZ87_9BACT|nr:putative Glycerol-3-phosphate acyltransferase [uncultured Desulfobacterium sp.]